MIRLVPNTGIQYAQLPAVPAEQLEAHPFRARRGTRFSAVAPFVPGNRPAVDDAGTTDGQAPAFRTCPADLRLLTALLKQRPEGLWLPLPFEGGGYWVSVFLRADPGPDPGRGRQLVHMALAVDTTLESDGNPDGLGIDELGERVPAPCAPRFWRHPAVERQVRALAAALRAEGQARQPAEEVALQVQMAIAGLADLLASPARGEPFREPLRVYMERRPESRDDVVVDMVLDLGNSRTCVLLKEHLAGGRRQRLELVYPDTPTKRDPSPFETQSAFFEHQIVPQGIEGTVSFRFLSILKMGAGALDALTNPLTPRPRDPRPLGISTPKRYLWEDRGGVDWVWRCANRLDSQQMSPPIHGDVLRRMDPRKVFASPAIPDIAQPDHPRVACMTWSVVELLEQAFRQINSPDWRRTDANAPLAERRRVIGSLVVTYPAGMHSVELENFRRASAHACRLWAEFRSSPEEFCSSGSAVSIDPAHGVPVPRVQMVCDEGMAIQLCWLYGESVHRFGSDAHRLVGALGRERGGRPTLRLASIDIGGGTVDLAVADYTVVPDLPAAVAFGCDRLFHDSISRAGDDVVRGILEDHVFPAVIKQVGCTTAQWNRLFAVSAAPEDGIRELRRELVRSVWMPVAMRCLSELEASAEGGVRVTIGSACTTTRLMERLSEALAAGGAKPKARIADVVVEMSRADMRSVVRNTIGRTIDQCADIIDQFDCDLLIVGGRPSGNPEIREQIYASMAVPPGQVVFLSELGVDDWYPFADGSGRIGDAKTCGVVGGAVAFEGRYGMGQFVLRTTERVEPPPIIGFLRDFPATGAPTFPDEHIIRFDSGAQQVPFMPMQPLVVACRRVAHPESEARPIYQVRLLRSIRDQLQRNPGLQREVSVGFELELPDVRRPASLGDQIDLPSQADRVRLREGSVIGQVPRVGPTGAVQEVEAERCIEILACSLPQSEGYWIDTGVFRALDGGDR